MLRSIPAGLSPIIGREPEVRAVRALIRENRLVALTGAGGSGKTRLASEIASQSAAEFEDGAGWVELAPLADAELLPTHLLDALRIEQGAKPPLDALCDTLRDRHALLVLDNCEHLVEACAGLTAHLLRECPRLHILVTTRESLGVTGERAWLVPGLSLPAASDQSVESIESVAAVRLFVERAQGALASFRLTEDNVAAVAQICRRLDGLPLAIELAAARVRTVPPGERAGRLDDAFRILTGGSRSAVPRHRTLREAIEWSYDLLSQRERILLQRLSMFAGDFSLQAAEQVGADGDLPAEDILDTLGALVDKSLVLMREEEGTARFQLLETIRQYARGRLEESGGYHPVCSRHAMTYLELAEEAAPHLITRERPQWVKRIYRELDNIRVALACTRDESVETHLRFLGCLGWFWYSSGHWSEGRKWFEGAIALAAPESARHDRARTLLGGGVLASLQGHTAVAVPWLEEGAALFRASGDESGEAYALAYLGVAWGLIANERAEEPARQALAWFRGSGDLYGLRLALVVLSTYCAQKGRLAEARELGEEGVAVARAYGLDRELAIALQVLAGVKLAMGDLAAADALFRECVGALRRDPSIFWTARALHMLALVRFRSGDAARGAYLMGAAEVVRETVGARFFGYDRTQIEPVMNEARRAVGNERFEAEWKAGRQATLADLLEDLARPTDDASPADTPPPAATAERAAAIVPPLEVRALGTLEILRDGDPLPEDAWRYARPRELLLYLLAHPEGRTRDQVGLVFWPDASAMQVKNNFHVMLHHVRKSLGRADLIEFDRNRYIVSWSLGVRFDARDFEESARAGLRAAKSARTPIDREAAIEKVRAALPLYRGEFLDGEDAGDWHVDIRDRLRRLFCEAALVVGDDALERGENREAAELFSRIARMDELNEAAHRKLMVALARGGARNEALRHYDRLAEVLRSAADTEPEKETKALYDRLRRPETV